MDQENVENAVGGQQQRDQQPANTAKQQYQPAGRAPPTLQTPIDRINPQSPTLSRFDQPIPRSNPGMSRSPVRETNRMHTYDNNLPNLAPQSRSMEPRFQQPPDMSRLHTGNNIVNGEMMRSPVEQNPHPDLRGTEEGNIFMPNSPSGSRQQYSMTRGNASAPGEFRRRLGSEGSSFGGDFGRTRRGSAEKLLQSVLDECESLIDGCRFRRRSK
jgi:hypothetical protein